MQIQLKSSQLIPTDTTLNPIEQRATQLSINLDAHRYTLVRRLGRVFDRTNRDVIIDVLDIWLRENIEQFPANEHKGLRELLDERKAVHSVNHRKP